MGREGTREEGWQEVTSVEAKKEWLAHLAICEQCQRYVHGVIRTLDEDGFARSWEACFNGRALWASVVNLQDKEYKNRT